MAHEMRIHDENVGSRIPKAANTNIWMSSPLGTPLAAADTNSYEGDQAVATIDYSGN
jgi:hypothetical protein